MQAIKRPAETTTFIYDFTDQLGAATISALVAGTPVAVARGGGALITVEGLPVVGTKTIAVKWKGGVAGESYLTTVRVTDTAGNVRERTGDILVVAATFALPTGIASRYLTGEEYVARYGTAETIRLTDENKTGQVDGAKLESAIGDATDEADAYIGTRYGVPLITAPRVVKSIVAAIAREKLHKTRPTDEVKAAADRARQMLRDIASSRMTLLITAGVGQPVGGDRGAQTSGDGGTDDFLRRLSGFSLHGGSYDPSWRH